MKVRIVACALFATAAAGCDRQASDPAAKDANTGETATVSPEIDNYLRQFGGGDPEDCFADAVLGQADFQAPSASTVSAAVTRVIVAVDASGSMAGRVAGDQKIALARTATAAFVDRLPSDAEAGLLVFGQAGDNTDRGKAKSCQSIDLTVPMTLDRAAVTRAAALVEPIGWTPLAATLKRAEALLARNAQPGAQVIYIVSDGQETCGGDPVAAARTINQGPSRAIINIIGFAVPSKEAASLAAVASAGGGRFVNAQSGTEVSAVAARIREEGRQASNRLAESGATARNTLATSGAVAKAQLCTSGLIARERLAVSGDIAKKRIAGRDVSLEERAQKVMAERHTELERRAAAFVGGQNVAGRRANEVIKSEADKAR